MDATQFDCDVASTAAVLARDSNGSKAYQVVARLQTRIAKAVKTGEWRKVRTLQRLLTKSSSAKALAVRRSRRIKAGKLQVWINKPGTAGSRSGKR